MDHNHEVAGSTPASPTTLPLAASASALLHQAALEHTALERIDLQPAPLTAERRRPPSRRAFALFTAVTALFLLGSWWRFVRPAGALFGHIGVEPPRSTQIVCAHGWLASPVAVLVLGACLLRAREPSILLPFLVGLVWLSVVGWTVTVPMLELATALGR